MASVACEPDPFIQKFLTEHYALILNVSKTLTKNYEDLAHDVCIKVSKCAECLKRVQNVKGYLFITARSIIINQSKKPDITPGDLETEDSPHHTLQSDYYNHPGLSSDEKFLLDLYLDSDLDCKKTAALIGINRRHTAIKIKKDMHEIEIILIGIASTFILHFMCFDLIDSKILPDKKPFNCVFCLSLWASIGLAAVTFSWYAVFVPITFHYSTKLLDRWT